MVKENVMKQTEIGLLPEDWEVNSLQSICKDMIQGINTAIDIPEYSFEGVPILKANNVIDGKIDLNNCEFISEKSFRKYSTRFHILKNDFLLSNIGARLGSGSIYLTDAVSVYAWNVMRLSPKKDVINPHYFSQILNSPHFNKLMINNQSGSGMGFVPKNVLQTFQIPLPPLPEQEAIAEALINADSWIESLEQLIAKKRLIKQGAMLELLSPKEDWEMKKLGEICDVRDGTHDSPKYIDDGVKFITSKNIVNNKIDFSEVSYISSIDAMEINKRSKVDRNDILMSMIGTIGNAVLIDFEPDFCIKNIALLKPKKINETFLIQLIKSPSFQELLNSKMDGGIQKFVSLGVLRNLDISFPIFPIEQARIATILSDMDAELEALEGQLGKARKVKQGMMQELLTGRVRLV